jgi:hypothetical protein
MTHAMLLAEPVEEGLAGIAVWEHANSLKRRIAVCGPEQLWNPPFGGGEHRTVGAVRWSPSSNTMRYVRYVPITQEEFCSICKTCLSAARHWPAIATPDAISDAECVHMLEELWLRFPQLTKAAIAGTSLREVIEEVNCTTPWAFVMGFYRRLPVTIFMSWEVSEVEEMRLRALQRGQHVLEVW